MNPFHRVILCGALFLAGVSGALGQEVVQLTRADHTVVSISAYGQKNGSCRGVAIISPGAGGSHRGYKYLGEAVASFGYLGVVVGHPESGRRAMREHTRGAGLRDGLAELITEPEAYRGRFMDIAAALQWTKSRCASAQRQVLIGHSMGAATAMMEAGARNKLGIRGGDGFSAYIAVSPQGPGSIFPENAWSGVGKPVLLLTGTRDNELDGGSWETRTEPFKSMPPGCKWLGVIDGANHMNFAGSGMSRRTEALTSQAIAAFLNGFQRNDCSAPARLAGMDLKTK